MHQLRVDLVTKELEGVDLVTRELEEETQPISWSPN
jgi:hypothetical protein